MRSSWILVLCIVGALMNGSCSSAEDGRNTQVNSSPPETASNSSVASNPSNANTSLMANGNAVVAPQTADANAVGAATSDSLQPAQLKDRLEKMKQADSNSGPTISAAEIAMKNSRPAPDNSTFATYLTDAGYEIRTFKNNPQILKVEKKVESNGSQSLKIFLRNGNVVQLPGSAIPILSTASAASIASAAGLAAIPVKVPETASTGAKKAVN
jgi:hypothetical protein